MFAQDGDRLDGRRDPTEAFANLAPQNEDEQADADNF
jgi:hypothetical protein